MFNPYAIIKQTDTHITYQYRTWCSWWLVATLAVLFVGTVAELWWLELIGGVSVLLHVILVLFPGLQTSKKIRAYMKENAADVSGGRYSMSDPLTIRVSKNNAPTP